MRQGTLFHCPTAGNIAAAHLEYQNRKRTEIAVLQVEAETRNARKSQQFLIDYWLEIGKLRRVRKLNYDVEIGRITQAALDASGKDPEKSRWVYIFRSDDAKRDLVLQDSWVRFFELFDSINLFIQFFDLDVPAYDPWNDPKWIQMDVRFPNQKPQEFRCVEKLL